MILSLLSIIVRLAESKLNLFNRPFVKTHEEYESQYPRALTIMANGKLSNMTIHQKEMKNPSNKLPPPMAQFMKKQSLDSSSAAFVFPTQRMGLDIKEVVLTNLDSHNPKPIVIQNHDEYSRENDEIDFSSRYLFDYTSATGKYLYQSSNIQQLKVYKSLFYAKDLLSDNQCTFADFVKAYARRVKCGGCHLNLTKGSSGEISSPGFPGDYGANTDCLWLLGAQYDAKIKLRYSHCF